MKMSSNLLTVLDVSLEILKYSVYQAKNESIIEAFR